MYVKPHTATHIHPHNTQTYIKQVGRDTQTYTHRDTQADVYSVQDRAIKTPMYIIDGTERMYILQDDRFTITSHEKILPFPRHTFSRISRNTATEH